MDTTSDTVKPSLDDEAKKALALKYADQVGTALRGKFPEYNAYVRHIETAEFNFIELALVDKKNNQEFVVAYSQEFFEQMVDPAVKQKKARRIVADLEIHLGTFKG